MTKTISFVLKITEQTTDALSLSKSQEQIKFNFFYFQFTPDSLSYGAKLSHRVGKRKMPTTKLANLNWNKFAAVHIQTQNELWMDYFDWTYLNMDLSVLVPSYFL